MRMASEFKKVETRPYDLPMLWDRKSRKKVKIDLRGGELLWQKCIVLSAERK